MGVTLENPRELRGLAILARGSEIRRLNASRYRVRSQSGNGFYEVVKENQEWYCTCPDHTHRQLACKHIYAVYFSLNLRQRVTVENLGLNESLDQDRCRICGSDQIIKLGVRHNKSTNIQKFKCKECGHYFSQNEGFERIQVTPKAITVALDLYFKGVSQRKISDHLKQFEGIRVTQPCILKWIKKYVALMKEYADKLTPQVGGMWHSDEMMVNIRKTEPVEQGNYSWLWNLMDHETRFLLASQITKRRRVEGARQVFQKAKAIAKGQRPDFVVTDKLGAYNQAFNREFYTNRKPQTKHVRLKNIREGANNNIVERLHGTLRERTKVMRGLDHDESAQKLIDGKRFYYNFIRPHQALNGKTPAEAAGINLNLGDNKWLELIRKARK